MAAESRVLRRVREEFGSHSPTLHQKSDRTNNNNTNNTTITTTTTTTSLHAHLAANHAAPPPSPTSATVNSIGFLSVGKVF
ncbi:hypothetical protein TB1_033522 [Malus domestica]